MRTSIILVLLSVGCAHTATPPPAPPKPPEPSVLGEPTSYVPELIIKAMSEDADNPYEVEYVQSPQTWTDLNEGKKEEDHKSHNGCSPNDPLCATIK